METNNNNSTQNAINAYLQECCVGGFPPRLSLLMQFSKQRNSKRSVLVRGKRKPRNKTKTTCENTKQLLAGKDEVMCEK